MTVAKAKAAPAPPALPPVVPTVTGAPQAYGTNAAGQTQWINFQPATPSGTGGSATFTGGYYQLEVLSALSASALVAALAATGWDSIAAQPDPYTANNWLVSAQWTGYPNAVVPAGVAPATFFLDGGSSSWQVNAAAPPVSLGSAVPAAPQANGTAAAPLIAGEWYAFSIRTAFAQTAGGTTNPALSGVVTLLAAVGWANSMVTAVASDPTNDTWNVIAQVPAGSALVGVMTDAPPLWIYVTGLSDAGATQPSAPSSAMPGALTATTL